MSNEFPMYLVDDPEGGAIEERAWVEVTDKTKTEVAAIEWLIEQIEPPENFRYTIEGRSYQKPVGVEVEGSDGELRTVKPLSEYPPCEECEGTGKFTGKGHDGSDIEDDCDDCYGTGRKGEFLFDSCEPIPWEASYRDHPESLWFWNVVVTDEPEAPTVSEDQTKMEL